MNFYTLPMADFLLDFLFCGADVFILVKIMDRMFGVMKGSRVFVLLGAGTLLLFFTCISHFLLKDYWVFFSAPFFLLLLFFYPKSRWKKLFFSAFFLSLWIIFCLWVNDLTNIWNHTFSTDAWIMLPLFLYHVLLWFLLFFCMKFCVQTDSCIPLRLTLCLFSVPVFLLGISLLSLWFLLYSSLDFLIKTKLHFALLTMCLLCDLIFYNLYRRFSQYWSEVLFSRQLALLKTYYDDFTQRELEIRKIRHDMKNHLQTAALLCRQGRKEELEAYLTSTESRLQELESVIFTGNKTLDAVLNIKLSQLKRNGILCTPRLTLPDSLSLDFSDTVTLLGNLFDNARAECLRFQKSSVSNAPCEIHFTMGYVGEALFLSMDNPSAAHTLPPFGTGLHNVEQTVRKYGGTFKIYLQDSRCYAEALLYCPLKNT